MTRIEEATNKILELIDIVKDVPKNESILAVGMDMVEQADKTMLDKICRWLKEHMYFTEGIANGEVYYQCKSMESFLNALK